MESIFFMMFEIATPTTTVNVYSGEPGTAKSMRFKRFQKSMSPGLVVQGGNKSARAGMQGACAFVGDSHNSCAHALLHARRQQRRAKRLRRVHRRDDRGARGE